MAAPPSPPPTPPPAPPPAGGGWQVPPLPPPVPHAQTYLGQLWEWVRHRFVGAQPALAQQHGRFGAARSAVPTTQPFPTWDPGEALADGPITAGLVAGGVAGAVLVPAALLLGAPLLPMAAVVGALGLGAGLLYAHLRSRQIQAATAAGGPCAAFVAAGLACTLAVTGAVQLDGATLAPLPAASPQAIAAVPPGPAVPHKVPGSAPGNAWVRTTPAGVVPPVSGAVPADGGIRVPDGQGGFVELGPGTGPQLPPQPTLVPFAPPAPLPALAAPAAGAPAPLPTLAPLPALGGPAAGAPFPTLAPLPTPDPAFAGAAGPPTPVPWLSAVGFEGGNPGAGGFGAGGFGSFAGGAGMGGFGANRRGHWQGTTVEFSQTLSAGAVAQCTLTRQNACIPRAALADAVCDGRDGFVRVCPVVGSVSHQPPRPVVAAQVALARQDPTPITLAVDAQQGTVVQWWYAPDPAGASVCRTRAWDDPVAYVYANVRLGAEARQWIEAGELQARYPGIAVRQGHLCVDGHPPGGPQLRGFPLVPWLPLDPGRHDVEVTLVTTTGAVATAALYAVDVHLLLSGVE